MARALRIHTGGLVIAKRPMAVPTLGVAVAEGAFYGVDEVIVNHPDMAVSAGAVSHHLLLYTENSHQPRNRLRQSVERLNPISKNSCLNHRNFIAVSLLRISST